MRNGTIGTPSGMRNGSTEPPPSCAIAPACQNHAVSRIIQRQQVVLKSVNPSTPWQFCSSPYRRWRIALISVNSAPATCKESNPENVGTLFALAHWDQSTAHARLPADASSSANSGEISACPPVPVSIRNRKGPRPFTMTETYGLS